MKDIEINFGMHKNVIEGLEAAGSPLQHVYFNAGGKWYGKNPHALLVLTIACLQPLSYTQQKPCIRPCPCPWRVISTALRTTLVLKANQLFD